MSSIIKVTEIASNSITVDDAAIVLYVRFSPVDYSDKVLLTFFNRDVSDSKLVVDIMLSASSAVVKRFLQLKNDPDLTDRYAEAFLSVYIH